MKCVFIDPPYNTGSAFEHYDDGVEHSLWLSLMRDRLELIRRLLSDDGSLWITIDDNEAHYLKVLCDEVFGRANFVANAIWQKKYSPQNDAKWLSDSHDHILIYAKSKELWRPNLLPRSDEMNARYRNPDNDKRGPWKPGDLSVKTYSASTDYPITTPSGRVVKPPKGYCWRVTQHRLREMISDERIWFGESGNNVPSIKRFLSEVKDGVTSMTIWTYKEVGHNQDAKKQVKDFNSESIFDTPKPEGLIERVLVLATNPGDLVIDSFAGSGTTGAVAHKMGRRWIMVELGEHCHTHIIPRLQKVIDGEDKGGVTEAAGWKGGGGFRYCRLAPSLIEKDRYGNAVISKEYNPAQLAEAVCKHMGFAYAPSAEAHDYWRHGASSERDFIFVTTASLNFDALKRLSDDVGPERTLLVCCRAFQGKANSLPNLTVKKIPQAVLANCEWGRDDYSLRIAALPEREENFESEPAKPARPAKRKAKSDGQPTLFEDEG